MSKAMNQVYEQAAAGQPVPPPAADPAPPLAANAFENAIAIALVISVLGIVFGAALARFGWQGGLIAVWPAFVVAGGAGCACQEVFRRVQRPR